MKNLGFCLTLVFVLWEFANQAFAQERATGEKESPQELLPKIRLFADNLIEHGRDRYGPKHTPLFVGQLDVERKTIPPADTKLYFTGKWTGTSGPTTSNLQYDNGLLRLLYGLTRITSEKRYALAADEYLRNPMRVTAEGEHIVVELNGETVVDVDGKSHPEILKRYSRGPVGFQNHGTPVSFRNIRVADLTKDRTERTKGKRGSAVPSTCPAKLKSTIPSRSTPTVAKAGQQCKDYLHAKPEDMQWFREARFGLPQSARFHQAKHNNLVAILDQRRLRQGPVRSFSGGGFQILVAEFSGGFLSVSGRSDYKTAFLGRDRAYVWPTCYPAKESDYDSSRVLGPGIGAERFLTRFRAAAVFLLFVHYCQFSPKGGGPLLTAEVCFEPICNSAMSHMVVFYRRLGSSDWIVIWRSPFSRWSNSRRTFQSGGGILTICSADKPPFSLHLPRFTGPCYVPAIPGALELAEIRTVSPESEESTQGLCP